MPVDPQEGVVEADLSVPDCRTFVVGDAAHVDDPCGAAVPGAHRPLQAGRYVAA